MQRLDTLEELVRGSPLTPGSLPATVGLSLEQAALNNRESPPTEGRLQALERTKSSTLYHINVESILSWPVFQSCNIAQKHELRALLKLPSGISEPKSVPVSLEFEIGGARQLLQRFVRHIHIYNPVLQIDKVQEYMRDTLFNGLDWDAKSCLLVSKREWICDRLRSLPTAFGICTRDYLRSS